MCIKLSLESSSFRAPASTTTFIITHCFWMQFSNENVCRHTIPISLNIPPTLWPWTTFDSIRSIYSFTYLKHFYAAYTLSFSKQSFIEARRWVKPVHWKDVLEAAALSLLCQPLYLPRRGRHRYTCALSSPCHGVTSTVAHDTRLLYHYHATATATNKHPFNGLFSRTTWVSRHQKGKIILDFNETLKATATTISFIQPTFSEANPGSDGSSKENDLWDNWRSSLFAWL